MKNLEKLVTGYKAFLDKSPDGYQRQYRYLADKGQSPKIMVIGCSDSRVNPDLIFDTSPGDLFVVRNVANLVPPFESDGAYHGTSAALEFAVTGLKVHHIVVMGHSLCGGVKVCCDGLHGHQIQGIFISKWASMLDGCAKEVLKRNPTLQDRQFEHAVELAGIQSSLNNLKTFPFVQERLKTKEIEIHGIYFDIKNAQLYALEEESQEFKAVE